MGLSLLISLWFSNTVSCEAINSATHLWLYIWLCWLNYESLAHIIFPSPLCHQKRIFRQIRSPTPHILPQNGLILTLERSQSRQYVFHWKNSPASWLATLHIPLWRGDAEKLKCAQLCQLHAVISGRWATRPAPPRPIDTPPPRYSPPWFVLLLPGSNCLTSVSNPGFVQDPDP